MDTQGDAFFLAFANAPDALDAAGSITERLGDGPVRLRVGVHTGAPLVTDEGYVGGDVHRAARIAAAGHGGQVLVSASTATLVDVPLRDLGEHRFKDLRAPERVFQLGDEAFPPLKSLHRSNLPVPGTPFLGREHELEAVVALLADPGTRLLTLTGRGARVRPGSHCRPPPRLLTGSPTACSGCRWHPCATRRGCCPRSRRRSR